MNRSLNYASLTVATLAGLLLGSPAFAQLASPKITITNTNPVAEIRLETGSTVEFAANGDLQVRCHQTAGSCTTQNLGSPGGGTNPPTNLSLTPSVTTLTAGSAFNLTWSSSNAEACFGAGPTSPSVNGWTGQPLPTSRGAPGLPLTLAQGTYNFQMRCFNATGSASVTASTVTVTEGGGGTPGDGYCSEYYNGTTRPVPTTASFNAHGFSQVIATFFSIWGVQPGIGGGPQVAVPGNFLNPSNGRYLAIPFTFTGAANQVTFNWIDSQGGGIPTGAVSVTISPCPGDFRPAVFPTPANDAYLSLACRGQSSGISGGLSAATPTSGLGGCVAPTGQQMYLNIATYNMYTTTTPTTSTCGGNTTCGVNMAVQ